MTSNPTNAATRRMPERPPGERWRVGLRTDPCEGLHEITSPGTAFPTSDCAVLSGPPRLQQDVGSPKAGRRLLVLLPEGRCAEQRQRLVALIEGDRVRTAADADDRHRNRCPGLAEPTRSDADRLDGPRTPRSSPPHAGSVADLQMVPVGVPPCDEDLVGLRRVGHAARVEAHAVERGRVPAGSSTPESVHDVLSDYTFVGSTSTPSTRPARRRSATTRRSTWSAPTPSRRPG